MKRYLWEGWGRKEETVDEILEDKREGRDKWKDELEEEVDGGGETQGKKMTVWK
jgi:hypothetical protein